jgi:hypothetical protein
MLHDPARHEPLRDIEWDARAAARMIERIVRDAEDRFDRESHWPLHPLDATVRGRDPVFNLYFGAGGVVWALHELQSSGAAALQRPYDDYVDRLLPQNRAWLKACGDADADVASYLMGDTGLLLLSHALRRTTATETRLEALIAGNTQHPARELMWGAPGTMLAAWFLYERTREARWRELYLASARALWGQVLWSPEYECRYWAQELYGFRMSSLGGVHGFVATAAPLIAGRHLMPADEWTAWEQCIVDTVQRTAEREGAGANWRPDLHSPGGDARPQKRLMQFCHGAPGFVVCLSGIPSTALDDDLLAGGEAIWNAGPLSKGSNLCHGTGGNGYAFLALYKRTGDERWLTRARAFAMHGIAQTEAHAIDYGRLRYSLWTGDLGFAVFLRDCIKGAGGFPTVQTF